MTVQRKVFERAQYVAETMAETMSFRMYISHPGARLLHAPQHSLLLSDYRSYAQYREPSFSPFKKHLLAEIILYTSIELTNMFGDLQV